MIYISKFRKDIKPLKIKFRKTIRNGARIYTPDFYLDGNIYSVHIILPIRPVYIVQNSIYADA